MSTEHITSRKGPPLLETIRIYIHGCNTSNLELILTSIAPDVVQYFPLREPVRGADALARSWVEFNAGVTRATWTVDHGIEQGDEAAIEFTAVKVHSDGRAPTLSRGAEWYKFRDGKITEIRPYSLIVSGKPIAELVAFPYRDRGYTLLER